MVSPLLLDGFVQRHRKTLVCPPALDCRPGALFCGKMIPRNAEVVAGEWMGKRDYRMTNRAETRDDTRARTLQAAMTLHGAKGVPTTTFCDIAERAKVGPATVYRNFPTLGALVQACGVHVWQDMRPPVPQEAPAVFAGVGGGEVRLRRLI